MSFVGNRPYHEEEPIHSLPPDDKYNVEVEVPHPHQCGGYEYSIVCLVIVILMLYYLRLAYYYVAREYDFGFTVINRPITNICLAVFYIPLSVYRTARYGLTATHMLIIYIIVCCRARPAPSAVTVQCPAVEVELERVVSEFPPSVINI